MLVKKCLCGDKIDYAFEFSKIYGLSILKCPRCGVLHQKVNLTVEKYYKFCQSLSPNTGDYYKERYDYDKEIAEQRMFKYNSWFKGSRLLDLGAATGAFVDVAREYGLDAWGVETNENLVQLENSYLGTLADQFFESQEFDNFTMHDVLQYLPDPVAELEEIHRVMAVQGILIVDIPDYYNPAGVQYWQPTEPLWFFDEVQCKTLLQSRGFAVLKVDRSTVSKIVLYAEKDTV